MITKIKQKIAISAIGILVATLLFLSPGLRIPGLDTAADTYFRDAITKGGLAYATCRVINATISVVKDSSLRLEPAGVGVSLAVGQALDPIDDMTERLSDVLVTAITSLGVQKLAYEISVSLAPQVLAVFLIILSILIWFENERLKSIQKIMTRFALFILIARFFLPISSLANEFINNSFFNDQISAAGKELAVDSAGLDKLRDLTLPEIDGILGTIKNSASFLKEKSREFNKILAATLDNMEDIIKNLLKLTFLYVGIFLIQVIFLPLLSFFFLVKITNALFNVNMPLILRHSQAAAKSKPESTLTQD